MRKINIIYCGYREWALSVFDIIKNHKNVGKIVLVKDNENFINDYVNYSEVDCIFFVGWSWIIKDSIINRFLCLGVHPSDLPNYRGGSPLQNQIIDGVINTKVSLFQLTREIDDGPVWLKQDLKLTGDSMKDVFGNLVISTTKLIEEFLNSYPDIKPSKQNIKQGSYYKRRKPTDSKIERKDFVDKPLPELYNKIRCLTDPYPNAFIEDEIGNKLIFTGIHFIEKKE